MNFGAKYGLTPIDITTWEALEEAGCVFLPQNRGMDYLDNKLRIEEELIGLNGFYSSSTVYNAQRFYSVNISSVNFTVPYNNSRFFMIGVRLVQDY